MVLLWLQHHCEINGLLPFISYPLSFKHVIAFNSDNKMDVRRAEIGPLGFKRKTAVGIGKSVSAQSIAVAAILAGLPMSHLGFGDRLAVRCGQHLAAKDEPFADIVSLYYYTRPIL